MTLTIDPELTGEKLPIPRLVRVMRYEHAERGGGPVLELSGRAELAFGAAEQDRVTGAAIEVADPSMSRRHAVLESRGRFLWEVRDLGSKNGTFVDGKQISAATLLQDGSLLEMGRTAWVFRIVPMGAPEHVAFGPTRSFSPKMFHVVALLDNVARTTIPVLLSGETGTGKEVFARELHDRSGRKGRFIAVNCGALTESLIESELFGHKKGAFTGAAEARVGHVQAADGGTLLLDEIGDMPLPAQVRLLRVLQEGEVVPLGETTPRKVDVRIVAASHKNLSAMIEAGTFRADLYARLNGVALEMPRLADRREDLGEIIAHVARSGAGGRPGPVRIGVASARALLLYGWPYNVRELVRVIEAAIPQAKDGRIERAHLPERVFAAPEPAPSRPSLPAPEKPLDAEEEALKKQIIETLAAHGGNVTRAAEALGKRRQQLQRWMRRFNIGGADD
ncbi:MAG: sigma 54-interacting transcriptional regulator [Labilithrix sp.]